MQLIQTYRRPGNHPIHAKPYFAYRNRVYQKPIKPRRMGLSCTPHYRFLDNIESGHRIAIANSGDFKRVTRTNVLLH